MRCRLFLAPFVCFTLLAGCGSDDSSSNPSVSDNSTDCPTAAAGDGAGESGSATVPDASFPAGKPAVEVPAKLPTELISTDLIVGAGVAAEVGDTVTVNYVGVRTVDGTEFDNSYDRGSTFPVTLGANRVIAGWEQGLIGIKAGGRRQLDIPADLAYGDNPQGDVIQQGDALTFIIDAVSITPGPPVSDPADAPVVDVPKSVGATEATITDLIEGDRCLVAERGRHVYVQIILYRGDTGEQVQSSWTTGQAIDLALDDTTLPGLVDGVVGMGVGGRRLVILPPALGLSSDVYDQMGIDPTTDLVLVIDLIKLA